MGTIIKPKSTTKTLLRRQQKVADKVLKEELEENKKRRRRKGYIIGGQVKLDKNKDGKITGEDFKMMRKKMMGGGMPMKDKKKMMGYMYGGKVKKMMGGGMTMKYETGGSTKPTSSFRKKCDGKVTQGRTRGTIVRMGA
tara:strand:+ start:969 stop:1385 length:417 start_codon:yes stop_codon:yes gene_type:complete